jgi:hypothetical protein
MIAANLVVSVAIGGKYKTSPPNPYPTSWSGGTAFDILTGSL